MTTCRFTAHIFVLLLTFVSTSQAAVKTTPTGNKTNLGSINEGLVDSAVEVEATVKSITPPREGTKAPVRINLEDATGSITLVVWADVFDVIKEQSPIEPGTTIHVNAHVSKYKDDLQLQMKAANDLRVIAKPASEHAAPDSPPAPASTQQPDSDETGLTPLASVTTAMANRDVTVKASISDVREPREGSKAPYIVTLTQDSTRIPLVFWSDIQQQIKQRLKVGNIVRVKAQVTDYRGTLQLKLRNAADFTVVTAAE